MKRSDVDSMFAPTTERDRKDCNSVRGLYADVAVLANNTRTKPDTVAAKANKVVRALYKMCPDNTERNIAVSWMDHFVHDVRQRNFVTQRRGSERDFIETLRTSMLWACESIARGAKK